MFRCGPIDGKDLIDDMEQSIERRLNRITTVDRNVAVQNLFKHFRAGN